ncbi:alpha/beta hydrolase [Paracoccus sp. (in: a-proteobacteria)]|uniref:alpha/beta hydrolase n=1 Tax=Paracoccus sp. TaxID=267 RepID=UPI00396C36C8
MTRSALSALSLGLAMMLTPATSSAQALVHEQTLPLWPARPASSPVDLEPRIVERSESLFRADRALMGIAESSLTVFLPDRPNGTSMIVAPGGSYRRVVLDKEGVEIAAALAEQGITSFLLAYRLPGEGHEGASDVPLADGQRAVRIVREHAGEWGLDPHRIGFLGFSAAGHLGASLVARHDRQVYDPVDAADEASARPDFAALVYPVVTMMDGPVHEGSREALLGETPSEEAKAAYSPERHVTANAPETFIVLADDDDAVPSENAIRMYQSLHEAGVKAELHIFRDGGHGFGIRGAKGLPVQEWPVLLTNWMDRIGMTGARNQP